MSLDINNLKYWQLIAGGELDGYYVKSVFSNDDSIGLAAECSEEERKELEKQGFKVAIIQREGSSSTYKQAILNLQRDMQHSLSDAPMTDGHIIDINEAEEIKSIMDGVTVSTLLCGNQQPYKLELTLTWPNSLPEDKVDFAIVSYNDGYSFLCLFSYGSFGPTMVYSENCHPCLAKDLKKTKEVMITENSITTNRTYRVVLKHC